MKNRIREIRKQKGITMKQLGEIVDLAESTISQYETGKRQPDNETLLKISEYFEVTVGYLLGAEDSSIGIFDNVQKSEEKVKSSVNSDPNFQHLVQLFENFNSSGKEELLKYAEYLASKSEYKKCVDIPAKEA